MAENLPQAESAVARPAADTETTQRRLSEEAASAGYSSNALVREVQVVGGGLLNGVASGWRDSMNHKVETALELGLPIAAFALTAAMPAPMRAATLMIGRTAGAVGIAALGTEAAFGVYNSASAIKDTWASPANAVANQATIESQLGNVAFNSVLMGGLSAGGYLGARAFFPKPLGSLAGSTSQMTGRAAETGIIGGAEDGAAALAGTVAESAVGTPNTVTAAWMQDVARSTLGTDGYPLGELPAGIKQLNTKTGPVILGNGIVVKRNPFAIETTFNDSSRVVQHETGELSIKLPTGFDKPRGTPPREFFITNQTQFDHMMAQPQKEALSFLREGVETGKIKLAAADAATSGRQWEPMFSTEESTRDLNDLAGRAAVLRSFDHQFFPLSTMQRGFLDSVFKGQSFVKTGVTPEDLMRLQRQAVEPSKGFLRASMPNSAGNLPEGFERVPEAVRPSVFRDMRDDFRDLSGGKPELTRSDIDAALWRTRLQAALIAARDGSLGDHSRTLGSILGGTNTQIERWRSFADSVNQWLDLGTYPAKSSPFRVTIGGPDYKGDLASTLRMKLIERDTGEVIDSTFWHNDVGQAEQTASDIRAIRELQNRMRGGTQA